MAAPFHGVQPLHRCVGHELFPDRGRITWILQRGHSSAFCTTLYPVLSGHVGERLPLGQEERKILAYHFASLHHANR